MKQDNTHNHRLQQNNAGNVEIPAIPVAELCWWQRIFSSNVWYLFQKCYNRCKDICRGQNKYALLGRWMSSIFKMYRSLWKWIDDHPPICLCNPSFVQWHICIHMPSTSQSPRTTLIYSDCLPSLVLQSHTSCVNPHFYSGFIGFRRRKPWLVSVFCFKHWETLGFLDMFPLCRILIFLLQNLLCYPFRYSKLYDFLLFPPFLWFSPFRYCKLPMIVNVSHQIPKKIPIKSPFSSIECQLNVQRFLG